MTEISEMTNEELNNAVAVEVMGWKKYIPPGDEKFAKYVLNDNLELAHYCFSWKPTENNDAAWQVAERINKLGYLVIIKTWPKEYGNLPSCSLVNKDNDRAFSIATTANRAICEAALMATRNKKG